MVRCTRNYEQAHSSCEEIMKKKKASSKMVMLLAEKLE